MEPKVVNALLGIGVGTSLFAVLVTVGLRWKTGALDLRLRKRTLLGFYAGLGLLWLLFAGVEAAGHGQTIRVAIDAVLGLLWLGWGAWVWRHPEQFRVRES